MSSEVEASRRSSQRELRRGMTVACHWKSGVKSPHSKARYRARQFRKSCELKHAWKGRQCCCVNHPGAELSVARLDLVQLFGRNAPLHVDLGCGEGSFLCEMAQQFPNRNFLGIERLTKRVEKVRRKAKKIENVRVLRADTLSAVRYLLPESSVETFYLLFPDPWPKRRHQFRRIFTRDFLDAIAAALEKQGVLRVATDQFDYFNHIERLSRADLQFQVVPWSPDDAVLPLTKFERKFLEQGASIYRLTLRTTSPVR